MNFLVPFHFDVVGYLHLMVRANSVNQLTILYSDSQMTLISRANQSNHIRIDNFGNLLHDLSIKVHGSGLTSLILNRNLRVGLLL